MAAPSAAAQSSIDDPYTLFTLARQPVTVSKAEFDTFTAIWQKHQKNQMAAYKEAPELYRKYVPLWAHPGTLKADILTDEQAKTIFPLFVQARLFELNESPNLTGACLSLPEIPKGVVWISAPPKTEYRHLRNISSHVKDLFVYTIGDRASKESMDLTDSHLTRICIPGPHTTSKIYAAYANDIENL